jgi:hypothetical protein
MNYIIPITDLTKSQVQAIKTINAEIIEANVRLGVLMGLPKTPTGRYTKQVASYIEDAESVIKNLKEKRSHIKDTMCDGINEYLEVAIKFKSNEMLSANNKFCEAFKESMNDEEGKPISVGKSETKEWFVYGSRDWNGRLEFQLNASGRKTSFGDFSVKPSRDYSYRNRAENITTDEWIASFGFKFTDLGLEFSTTKLDSYGLFTNQVDNLIGSDIDFLVKALGEMNELAIHLGKYSDLQSLSSLSRTYIWVEKVFDIALTK